MKKTLFVFPILVLAWSNSMAVDIPSLWDYSKPAVSEQRFRQALKTATADEALVLQTQIARSWGIRKDFARAREILASIEAQAKTGSPLVQVHYFLELGRTYASPVHPPATQTPANKEVARSAYMRAFDIAQKAGLDVLAIDALHMMVMVDTEPQAQIEWNQKALEYMERSSQPDAKKWEAPLRNNVGHAQRLAGKYDEALRQFKLSLAAYERRGNAYDVRVAHWMIARTLRDQRKYQEAIDIQLRLEREWDQAGEPDPYVYEELEHLYRAVNDTARADAYGAKLRAARKG